MRQLRLLTLAMKEFQDTPTPECKQALIEQMTAYAEAVNTGQAEQAVVWRSN